MEKDKLKKGNELDKEIQAAKELLYKWDRATCYPEPGILVKPHPNQDSFYIPDYQDTFEIVKSINVKAITKKLAELEAEFAKL